MAGKEIFVKKMNGDLEKYNEEKLRKSLIKAGASNKTIDKIMGEVLKILYDGIETKKLFKFIFDRLKKLETSSDLRYNLKNAIIRLRIHGGFVFENLLPGFLRRKVIL